MIKKMTACGSVKKTKNKAFHRSSTKHSVGPT